MKIMLERNNSGCHVGSAAVWQYLTSLIHAEEDLTLAGSIEESDCLIINGEGTMHDGLGNPGVIAILNMIKHAKDLGKRVYLINSVWQNMTCPQADFIKLCDSVFVREVISFNEIKSIRPDAKISIDLSYFAPIVKPKMLMRDIAVGGFYDDSIGWTAKPFLLSKGYKDIYIRDSISWQDYIDKLSVAKLLVTGLHHEAIAAMKLRIPFVAFKGNTDKVLGIIKMSAANIPVANNVGELFSNIDNLPPQKEYDKLFDFLENEKPFNLNFLRT